MPTSEDILAIRNVSVFDGTGGPTLHEAAVVIERGRIAWIGPEASSPVPAERAIDGRRGHLLPGLVNCHVHLCNDGSADFFAQARDDSPSLATVRALNSLYETVRSGVTTVRDCGAANGTVVELARAVRDGLVEGPRILAAGRVITMTGGHGHFIGREADGPDGVRAATRLEIKGGADFIKTMATGGVLTPGVTPTQTALQLDELSSIVREAHNAGRRVATHAIGNEGIKNALRAGVDSIEHGFYLDDEAFELALDRGTYLVPTLIAVNRIVEAGVGGGIPDWVVEKAESESGHHRESFAAAVRSGMKIAAGTDAGTPFNPHEALAVEVGLMVEYGGLSATDALLAATRHAADNLGLGHLIGTVEVGKAGDVIVVDGDPVADLKALHEVRLVAKDGHLFRNDLS